MVNIELSIKSINTNIPIKKLNVLKKIFQSNILQITTGLDSNINPLVTLYHNKTLLVELLLTNDKNMIKYNNKYRNQPITTNVISLQNYTVEELFEPIGLPIISIGVLIISIPTALKEANIANITFEEHCIRLLIHGLLHLLGYTHEEELNAVEMYNLEQSLLTNLNITSNSIIENYWK